MTVRNARLNALGLAIVLATLPLHAQQNPARQGLDAFNAGDYATALDYFEQAEDAGVNTPALRYNIAVSLYRLGRYAEARERFQTLVAQAEWNVLVTYNLGLVAEAEGDTEQALAYYRAGAAQQEQPKIRELAGRKLALLAPSTQATAGAAPKSWLGLLALSGGHDSNASSLADDLLDNNASAGDEFLEALLYGQWYVHGAQRKGTRMYGMLFDRRFDRFSHLDTQVLGAGLVHERAFGPYQTETGLRLSSTWLDSRTVADQAQLTLGVSRQFAFGTLGSTYAYSRIDAGDDFAQTEGNQHRLDLSWTKRIDALTLQGRYRYEDNAREDLRRGEAFASYSPQRDSLYLGARWQFTTDLSAGASAEYIDSDYAGVNRLRDTDGRIVTAARENRQQRYVLDTTWRIQRNWRVRAEYQHNEVEDTFALYTFDKNRVMATVEFEF